MLPVHIRINDAATGKPTAVRIRFLTADGRQAVPLGRLATFAPTTPPHEGGSLLLGNERFQYVDGTCEVPLPPGSVTLEISKGPEFSPLRCELALGPGKLALRTSIARWIDVRAEGWYSGDTHALAPMPHAALLEGAAEDLAVVNLLARELPPHDGKPATLGNLLAFSGTRPALEGRGCLLVVNTLNSHPVLGTVALLNCHRLVYPLRFGGPDSLDDWSVLDWCAQCHRKSGLVVWPDLPRLTEDHLQGEALAAVLLGHVDAYEISRFPDAEPAVLADWYRLLNCGMRVPLAGGSGKVGVTIPLGLVRTYAQLHPAETFSYAAWIEAVRRGRTFVTNGPLLKLTVDDQGPGSVLAAEPAGQTVRIRAEAQSVVPFDQLEVLVNGHLQASKSPSGNRQAAAVETEVRLTQSAWIVARCWGRDYVAGDLGQCVYAHTSPVWVENGVRSLRPDARNDAPLQAILARTKEWVQQHARCSSAQHRLRLEAVLESASRALQSRCGTDGPWGSPA
jgi:hypothetical protein